MKIRAGFVSNSSSTSFLIISKTDLNKRDFLELMGIRPDSPIAYLFEQFYVDVIDSVRTRIDFKNLGNDVTPAELFDKPERLSQHMLDRINDAQAKGLKVYYGWLDSESNPVEAFFCTDSFEIESDKIYFNGLENVW